MNIVEFFHEKSLQRNCSANSISTVTSSFNTTPETSPRQEQINNHLNYQIQNLRQLSPQISQMIPEQEQFPVDISHYLSKRKIVMSWLKRYGYQLHISRNAEAAAQLYSDLYYHNNTYERQQVKMILTSLLILGSKHSDYKILFTNHIAYICDLDQRELNKVQLQSCCKIGFDFSRDTYVMVVDRIIHQISTQTGYDLYKEDENCYFKLRLIHGVVERMYTEVYQWDMDQQDIVQVFRLALAQQSEKSPGLLNFLTEHAYVNMKNESELDMQETIQMFVNQFRVKKQEGIRQLFRNRQKTQKYANYAEFSVKYFFE